MIICTLQQRLLCLLNREDYYVYSAANIIMLTLQQKPVWHRTHGLYG